MLVAQALCRSVENQDSRRACKVHCKLSSMVPQSLQLPKIDLDKQQKGHIPFEAGFI